MDDWEVTGTDEINQWLDEPIGEIDTDYEVAIAYVKLLLAENERLQAELAAQSESQP